MREFIIALTPFTLAVSATAAENPLWERLLEKWGIAFVMFILFWTYTKRQQEKDDDAQEKKDETDAAAQRKKNAADDADKTERLALLGRIETLNAQQLEAQGEHIKAQASHAGKLEQLQKDTVRAITDAEAAHRMLTRRFLRPCIAPLPPADE